MVVEMKETISKHTKPYFYDKKMHVWYFLTYVL